jgi:hypothetical protein
MQNKLKNYVIYISILTLIMMIAYFFLRERFAPQTAYIIPGYFLITMVTHLILRIAFSKDPRKFSMNFIGALAFKMLASFAFLTIMFMAFEGLTKDFVAVFMVVYLIYTVFEIAYLKPLAKTPKA